MGHQHMGNHRNSYYKTPHKFFSVVVASFSACLPLPRHPSRHLRIRQVFSACAHKEEQHRLPIYQCISALLRQKFVHNLDLHTSKLPSVFPSFMQVQKGYPASVFFRFLWGPFVWRGQYIPGSARCSSACLHTCASPRGCLFPQPSQE